MLQPAGDLGLDEEALADRRVVGVAVEDLLQRDLALEQRFRPEGRGRVVLTASRGTEYSFEGDQLSGEAGQSEAPAEQS